ncbi:MAG: hypothetical protein WD294_09325 [Phycisphaeraceae bacterium]
MVNHRQVKRSLVAGIAISLLLTVAVLASGLMLPIAVDVEQPTTTAPRAGTPTHDRSTSQPTAVPLEALLRVTTRNWRQPLFDVTETTPEDTQQQAPRPASAVPMTVQLMGTVIEHGRSMALLRKTDGTIAICSEGETVDDSGGPVLVERVEANSVTVHYAGAARTLELPVTPAGGS